MRIYGLFLVAVLAGCIEKNPDVCCETRTECEALGVDDFRNCTDGKVCDPSSFSCVAAECSTDVDCPATTPVCTSGLCYICDADHGCPTSAAVCDVAAQTCSACSTDADCASFADAPLCDAGVCVECRAATDCPTSRPVCDAGACRACTADADCDSGACADDWTCIDPAQIVYIAPGGNDGGACTQTAPCAKPTAAIAHTSVSRPHIVFAPGTYTDSPTINSTTTSAATVWIHGHGAQWNGGGGDAPVLVTNDLIVVLQDLIVNANGASDVIRCDVCNLMHVQVRGAFYIGVKGNNLTLNDVQIEGGNLGIATAIGTAVRADRLTVHDVITAISDQGKPGNFTLTNLLVYKASAVALDLGASTGSISFATIADSGLTGATDHTVICGTMAMHASIVWVPGGSQRTVVYDCDVDNSIIGPTSISGMAASDPMFVDETSRDYHLTAGSPAIDQATTGPDHDLGGVARPRGASYDLGAYEYTPQ